MTPEEWTPEEWRETFRTLADAVTDEMDTAECRRILGSARKGIAALQRLPGYCENKLRPQHPARRGEEVRDPKTQKMVVKHNNRL